MPRGCWVVVLVGWGCSDAAKLPPGAHDCRFTQVSRTDKAGNTSFTRVSRLASLPLPPYSRGCAPEPRPNSADRHEGWHVGPLGGGLNPTGGSLNPSMRTLTPWVAAWAHPQHCPQAG